MEKYKYDKENANNKLVIIVNSKLKLDIFAEIGTKKYVGKDNRIEIEQIDTSYNEILFSAKVKNKNKYNYNFYLHKHDSSGIFQWSKTLNFASKKICFSNKKSSNSIVIVLDVDYFTLKNIYMIDNRFLTIKVNSCTKINTRECKHCNDTKHVGITSLLDYIFLFCKNLIWLLLGADLCLYAYKTKFEANSIFSGNMIWVDVLLIACVFIFYTVFSCVKMFKYKKKERAYLMNS